MAGSPTLAPQRTARPVEGPRPPTLDVVVPVHDEERALAESVRRLHAYLADRFPFSWRITIVDNASTDRTWEIARGLADSLPHVVARRLERKGRGLALRTAWSASDAAVLAYTDVDLSTDLDALLPLVAPLVSGHSDVAIGSRLSPGASVARGPKRELVSRAYNTLLRTVFATRVRDAQCGFKALRADAARRLLPRVEDDAWFFDTELLLLAERNGMRIHQVPVDWVDDPDSRVDVVRTARDDLRGVVRLVGTFLRGEGRLPGAGRAPQPDDLGRRLVSFGLVGAASTAVSLALFLALRPAGGAVAANALAVTATFVGNTWANARFTARTRRPRWGAALGVYAGSLALTSAVLLAVDAAPGGLGLELVALCATWTVATLARLSLLGRPDPERVS